MKLFKWKAVFVDDEVNNMDLYVRAEREEDVVGFAVSYYNFDEEAEPGQTAAEIADANVEEGWYVEWIKEYPPSSKVKAGAIDWDTAHRLMHNAL